MRARAKVTDIAVLVVAADDGVMPQTKDRSRTLAQPRCRSSWLNKVDLPDVNADKVKSELAAEGLEPEEWGGTTSFEVSAKEKRNLDDLLEKVLLVPTSSSRVSRRIQRRKPLVRSSSPGSTSVEGRSPPCSCTVARRGR